ncbi:MAG: hypothetical protein CM15mP62_25560 [Rhodospirillaceae bacterium]|nr:MAG: hypothetical protein CM15mP62_25560 [Rhodospirillaceae bacterium]
MSDKTDYQPPTVWKWDGKMVALFAKINRPTAGATHEKILPSG